MNHNRKSITGRKTRPLRLARETIRVLHSHQLADVGGGFPLFPLTTIRLASIEGCHTLRCAESHDCKGVSYAADCSIGAAAGGCD